jgi:hypothetical protein
MLRRELLTALGLGQLFRRPVRVGVFDQQPDGPRCFGIVDGKEVEIFCPPEKGEERCSNNHLQKPAYIVDLALRNGDEEKSLTLRICSTCGGCYALPEMPEEPSK